MNVKVVITRRADSEGYDVAIDTSKAKYQTRLPETMSADIREDVRNLRWKAIDLRDPGDVMLIEVGSRIARLLFPSEARDVWWDTARTDAVAVRMEFGPGTEDLFHVPWELMCVDGQFLLQREGSHLVREWGPDSRGGLAEADYQVLYVSFSTDGSLDFQAERRIIDTQVRASGSVGFLVNPSNDQLKDAIRRIRPSIVHLAGHGSFYAIEGVHWIETTWPEAASLETLLDILGDVTPEILVLGICESARLPLDIGLRSASRRLPTHIVAYGYPVTDEAALEATRTLYKALADGKTVSGALGDVRAVRLADPYSFFNTVHYQARGGADTKFACGKKASDGRPFVIPDGPELIGRDADLARITDSAAANRLTAIVAPSGFGATSVLAAWAWMRERTEEEGIRYLGNGIREEIEKAIRENQTNGKQLLVIHDHDGSLSHVDTIGVRVVRCVSAQVYKHVKGESVLLLSELDYEPTKLLVRNEIQDDALVEAVRRHPLASVPGFVSEVWRDPKHSLEAAEKKFEDANRMAERFAMLSEEGKRVAGLLRAVAGASTLEGDEDEINGGIFGMSRDIRERGKKNAADAKVIFWTGKYFQLSPDFELLAEKWLPNWAAENHKVLEQMFMASMTLAAHGEWTDDQADFARTAMSMAIFMRAWGEAVELLMELIPWHSNRGTLAELLPALLLINNNVGGMRRIIVTGTIAKILMGRGRIVEALDMHIEAEQWLRAHPNETDCERNLIASITGQVDCFTHLGMPKQASAKIGEAMAVAETWPKAPKDLRPRILAQVGEIRVHAGDLRGAVEGLQVAFELAQKAESASLVVEVGYALASALWRVGELKQAEELLERIESEIDLKQADYIYSKILDLKGKLLAARNDPRAIEFLLESYELDLDAGNVHGAVQSLVGLVKVFVEMGDLARAEERLEEAAKLVGKYGMRAEAGSVEYYRGILLRERGDILKARESFLLSEKLDRETGQFRHAAQARMEAEDCEPRENTSGRSE